MKTPYEKMQKTAAPWVKAWQEEQAVKTAARVAERRAGAPWHVDDMVTEARAETVARALFPEEYNGGNGCACAICREYWDAWRKRVTECRDAMREAFAGGKESDT